MQTVRGELAGFGCPRLGGIDLRSLEEDGFGRLIAGGERRQQGNREKGGDNVVTGQNVVR